MWGASPSDVRAVQMGSGVVVTSGMATSPVALLSPMSSKTQSISELQHPYAQVSSIVPPPPVLRVLWSFFLELREASRSSAVGGASPRLRGAPRSLERLPKRRCVFVTRSYGMATSPVASSLPMSSKAQSISELHLPPFPSPLKPYLCRACRARPPKRF